MLVLNEENIYSNFIDSVASPFTKETYASSLKQYMTFLQINKFSDLVSMEQSRINENIKSYILHMKKSGRSTKSIRSLLNGVKSFYNMNDIENIRWKKLQKFIGEDSEINEDRAYYHEEIQRILNVADLRTKVIILLMASAGLRVGALSGLCVQHVKN
ncbi:MAG: site-specific integrase, partial [Nitrososphaeraceae archaeon]